MDGEEYLKREKDLNCAPRYFKAVNYSHDYNENTEIKKKLREGGWEKRPTAFKKKKKRGKDQP